MSERQTNREGPGRGRLVFVVDDEPMLLELAAIILQPQGYVVKTFRDPELAVESFERAEPRPGLVVTDYAMHTMNGMEVVERLRQVEPRLKILLISGTVGEDIFRNASEKPNAFLAKPYQPRQLIKAVGALLE